MELGPFDYEHEVRTVNLWWSEGLSDYYADVILARAGLNSPADFAQGWPPRSAIIGECGAPVDLA